MTSYEMSFESRTILQPQRSVGDGGRLREYYNAERIHSAIDYKSPNEFASCELTSLWATPSTASTCRNTLLISNNRRTINLSEITV